MLICPLFDAAGGALGAVRCANPSGGAFDSSARERLQRLQPAFSSALRSALAAIETRKRSTMGRVVSSIGAVCSQPESSSSAEALTRAWSLQLRQMMRVDRCMLFLHDAAAGTITASFGAIMDWARTLDPK